MHDDHRRIAATLAVFMAASCAPRANDVRLGPGGAAPASGGLDLAGMDRSIAPGDDFFAFANGAWLQSTEIPADRSTWGASSVLAELTARRVADLLQETGKANAAAGSDAKKIGDCCVSCMNEARSVVKG